jgi:nicotinamidase-related amidase
MLNPSDAVVALIDIQERHYPHVLDGEGTLARVCAFLRAARALDVPLLWTEQAPRAFGPTLPAVAALLEGVLAIPKKAFGAFGEPAFARAVEATGRRSLYLVGVETHVCISQTALAGLERGLEVVVLADCVTGRHARDHEVALARLARAGATITTWEAAVYEWMGTAEHPRFKAVLEIVKAAAP